MSCATTSDRAKTPVKDYSDAKATCMNGQCLPYSDWLCDDIQGFSYHHLPYMINIGRFPDFLLKNLFRYLKKFAVYS